MLPEGKTGTLIGGDGESWGRAADTSSAIGQPSPLS